MKTLEESANRSAARNFAKILAVIIILSVAAFGDIMYIMEMQKVFTSDPSLLIFCYLGAFTSFAAVGYLLLGKSVVFSPGGQMIAAWIVFAAELLIIALNIILVFDKAHTGFLAVWAFLSPATPVFHMVGIAMIYFLDPEHLERQRDKELQSRIRQLEREHEFAIVEARMAVKKKHLGYTIRGLDSAANSSESLSQIERHAESINTDLLTEMSGKAMPKEERQESSYNDRYYGRR